MDIAELEKTLYQLTESEQRYLREDFTDYSQASDSIRLGNQEVFRFSLKSMIKETNAKSYFIRKQSRFAPVPSHITDVIELNFVYHGQSIQYINGKEILLEEGDLILIDTQTSHEVARAALNDIIISINIEQDFFKEHFVTHLHNQSALTQFLFQAISESQNHNQYLLFRSKNSQNLKLLFQQLLCEVYDPKLLDYDYKNHLLQLILLELIRSFSVEANGTSPDAHRQELTLNILSYINNHFKETSLDSCALHFGYNSSYFSRLVKDYTGQTFKKLLQDKRLEASLPLLLHSQQSIREIALEVGFSNLNHYYQLFKNKYGMTPAQYRRQILDNRLRQASGTI